MTSSTTRLSSMFICKLKTDTDPEFSYLCALPWNILHKILFAFLFYRLGFAVIGTIFRVILWVLKCILRPQRIHLIRATLSHIDAFQCSGTQEKAFFYKFVFGNLKVDGVLIVRLISLGLQKVTTAAFFTMTLSVTKGTACNSLEGLQRITLRGVVHSSNNFLIGTIGAACSPLEKPEAVP